MSKFWYFHFSAKNRWFSAKKDDFHWFWLKFGDFSLKNENIKILVPNFILLVVRTNISKNEPNRTIWWWVVTFFVIFHKSRFSAWDADFSVKIIHILLNFHFFCISAYYFQKYSLNLCFGPIYSLFGPFLGELEPFLAPKVPFFGHFYIGLYIRKVRFSDIPGRTRMAVESRHANIFSFRKKFW